MNGELVAWEDAKVHVLTHGLHYGTGVFEGIRCYDTEIGTAVFRPRAHTPRLVPPAGAHYMAILSHAAVHARPRPPTAARPLVGALLHAAALWRRGNSRRPARADRPQRPALVLHPP